MAKKIEFSKTTVLQRDAWGNLALVIIIPKEQEGSFDFCGGDIVEVTIKPVKKDKSDVAKDR